MADSDDMQELLSEFEELERTLALKELELGCARVLVDEYLYRSDLGWLITTVPGAGGALLAVESGQRVAVLREQIAQLEAERADLACERRLVEEKITAF